MARPREFDEEEVLEAAMVAFWERGYEATSVADLMTATGLQKGSLYKAFGDKRRLFDRALERYLEAGVEATQECFAEMVDPRSAIRCWLKHLFRPSASTNGDRRGCFAVNAFVELAPHDHELADRLAGHFDGLRAVLAEVIAQGQRDGQFRNDVAAKQLAEVLMTLAVGALASARGPQPDSTADRGPSLIDTVAHLLEANA